MSFVDFCESIAQPVLLCVWCIYVTVCYGGPEVCSTTGHVGCEFRRQWTRISRLGCKFHVPGHECCFLGHEFRIPGHEFRIPGHEFHVTGHEFRDQDTTFASSGRELHVLLSSLQGHHSMCTLWLHVCSDFVLVVRVGPVIWALSLGVLLIFVLVWANLEVINYFSTNIFTNLGLLKVLFDFIWLERGSHWHCCNSRASALMYVYCSGWCIAWVHWIRES